MTLLSEQAAAVAAKLTKAQREVLQLHLPTYGSKTNGWPGSALRDDQSFNLAGREMMSLNLVRWEDRISSRTVLTPLGLAVRAILLEQATTDEGGGA